MAEQVKGKREFEVYEACQNYVNEMCRQDKHPAIPERVKERACEYGSEPLELVPVLAVALRDAVLKEIPD